MNVGFWRVRPLRLWPSICLSIDVWRTRQNRWSSWGGLCRSWLWSPACPSWSPGPPDTPESPPRRPAGAQLWTHSCGNNIRSSWTIESQIQPFHPKKLKMVKWCENLSNVNCSMQQQQSESVEAFSKTDIFNKEGKKRIPIFQYFQYRVCDYRYFWCSRRMTLLQKPRARRRCWF